MSDWTETPDEMYARVQQMMLANGGPRRLFLPYEERQSVRFMLGLVNVLADRLAGATGTTVPHCIKSCGKEVIEGES